MIGGGICVTYFILEEESVITQSFGGHTRGANRTTVLGILICVQRVKKSVLETHFNQLKIPEAMLMSKTTIRWIKLKGLLPR